MNEFDDIPPLPTGARETERITIRAYLNADGSANYNVFAHGADHLTSYLGLLVIGQHEVLKMIKPTVD